VVKTTTLSTSVAVAGTVLRWVKAVLDGVVYTAPPPSAKVDQILEIWVKLTDEAGNPLVNQPIYTDWIDPDGYVTTQGAFYTGADGVAMAGALRLRKAGSWLVKSYYEGGYYEGAEYAPSEVKASISVTKIKTSLTWIEPPPSSAAKFEDITITVQLKDEYGNPLSGQPVYLHYQPPSLAPVGDWNTYRVETDANGYATWTISLNEEGTWKFYCSYDGTYKYEGCLELSPGTSPSDVERGAGSEPAQEEATIEIAMGHVE